MKSSHKKLSKWLQSEAANGLEAAFQHDDENVENIGYTPTDVNVFCVIDISSSRNRCYTSVLLVMLLPKKRHPVSF
ncbi:hypothetical protein PHJA_000413600 [Phtheirospermum japonicum]|uniref:Uncharacterized protein n=1 Tax=Phtheirospermum japonicum TaxID=374723 RepID=A0A830BFK5_9LAMI|nr:hypothetical protein PHJA_000413600 [Phtheirospermum japonicum]